jgi:hypothetical protein
VVMKIWLRVELTCTWLDTLEARMARHCGSSCSTYQCVRVGKGALGAARVIPAVWLVRIERCRGLHQRGKHIPKCASGDEDGVATPDDIV